MATLENTKESQVVSELFMAFNSGTFNPERFAKAVSTQHKTLQQIFFKTMIATMRLMASPGYSCDRRNQASCKIARDIVSKGVLDDVHLPMI